LLKKLLLVLVPLAIVLGWLTVRGTPAPEVPYTRPIRETIVSTLTTNGKVEPVDWAEIHADAAGPVSRIFVSRGQVVQKGQILAAINSEQAETELTAARSRVSAAEAGVETVQGGGRAPELAEVESGLARARSDLAAAQIEAATMERLVAKRAGTAAELTIAKDAVRRAQQQIDSLEKRRAALVTAPDRRAAMAKLEEAQSGVAAANRRIADGLVRSPMDGILYGFDLKPGAFVQPGTPIARVGRLDQLKVTVYVDEPELGRVERGMPVTITWDALSGRTWTGQVNTIPLQVVSVGTRQVGEVICLIGNPDRTLIPGTNVNAEIRSKVVQNALTLPKEVLRREGTETGVLKVQEDRVIWTRVKVGVASVTRVQITEGISDSDRIALPTDVPLRSGEKIRPIQRT